MTAPAKRFPYVVRDATLGEAGLAPMLPIILQGTKSLGTEGLVDSGATLNVLPYDVGRQLGADWDHQTIPVNLRGILASCEARAILVQGIVADFSPVRLAFAWAKTNAVPVLLGQVNFFLEFDVCFYRSQKFFEIRPKQTAQPSV